MEKETLLYTDSPTAKHTCAQNTDTNMSDLIVDKLGGQKEAGRQSKFKALIM